MSDLSNKTPSSNRKVAPKISRALLDRARNIKSTFSVTETADIDNEHDNPVNNEDHIILPPSNVTNDNDINDLEKQFTKTLSVSKPRRSIKIFEEEEEEEEEEVEEEIVKSVSLTKQLEEEASKMNQVKQQEKVEEEVEEVIVPYVSRLNRNKRVILDDDEKEDQQAKVEQKIVQVKKEDKKEKKIFSVIEITDEEDVEEEEEQEEEVEKEEEDEEEDEPIVQKRKPVSNSAIQYEEEEEDGEAEEEEEEDEEEPIVLKRKPVSNSAIQYDEEEEEEEEDGEAEEGEEEEDEDLQVSGKRSLTAEELEVEADDLDCEEEVEEDDEEANEDDDDFIDDEDDDDDYYEEEDDEDEDEDYVPPKRTRDNKPIKATTKSTSTSTRIKNLEQTYQDKPKQKVEENVTDTSTENDHYEDQMNGFFKNLRTGDYHDTTKYVDEKTNKEHEFVLNCETYEALFWYQREGIDWMWKLFVKGAGGILGDDMGLGKTMQVISFLKHMHKARYITHSLVVLPVSLIEHWVKEFEKRQPAVRVLVYHGNNQRERQENLETIKRLGGVLITTYGMIVSNCEPLKEYKKKPFTWDYIVLDEGHKIKETKTKISKTMRELLANYKIIMTGTAIQNNLRELWALFDWVCDGSLLGSVRSFATKFEKPILKAHIADSSQSQKTLGSAVAESLRQIIAPYFLRREKKDVFPTNSSANSNSDSNQQSSTVAVGDSNKENNENISNVAASSTAVLPSKAASSLKTKRMSVKGIKSTKNDLVCWIKLAEPQIEIYKTFLGSDEVKDALNKTSSPLAALTVLKKISDHPLLLHEEMSSCSSAEMKQIMNKVGENQTIKSLVRNSGKMQFLYYLLPNLKKEGHRLLIFSQSVKMLNAIQILLDYLKLSFLRIDGSISSSKERQKRIDEFNNDREIFCFLLTIQVGALGLNMTSADRVVIFDPSWNTVDNQAVDRVYRIGQTKDVVVYRLMCCGTIEEKIYRKQVFKGALMKTMLNQGKGQHRYFSSSELRELFILGDTNVSSTQMYLEGLHSSKRKTSEQLNRHIQFLTKLNMLAGLSDHDLLFTEEVSVDHNDDDVKMVEQQVTSSQTPSKQPRKKKITIVTKDTPNKSKIMKQNFIYVDDDYNDDEIDLTVETYNPRNINLTAAKKQSISTNTSTAPRVINLDLDNKQQKQQPRQLIPPSVVEQKQSQQLEKQIQNASSGTINNNIAAPSKPSSHSHDEYNRLILEANKFSKIDKVRSINLLLDALKLNFSSELEGLIKQEYSSMMTVQPTDN